MNYWEVRAQINTGDVIGIATRGPLSALIRWVQRLVGFGDRSDMSHMGVAKWIDGRLFLVEMDGVRNVMCPLSQYLGLKMYVFASPVSEVAMTAQFDAVVGRYIGYGYFDLIRIGVRMVFGLESPSAQDTDQTDLVCSHFVLNWLMLAGWVVPSDMPSEPSPCELGAALAPKFTISKEII
jgi:hypothetical protein